MVNCTKEAVLSSGLATRPGLSVVVTAVLSNFICDAGRAADQSELLESINNVICGHVSALSEYAQSNVTSRIVIVPPLPRSDPDWFSAYLPGLTSLLISQVLGLSSPQIKCLSPFISPANFYESDGVHLNSAAGLEFIKYIFAGVDQAFPVIDCLSLTSAPSSTQLNFRPQPSSSISLHGELQDLSAAVQKLTSVTETFQAGVLTRREQDNLVFARLKEDRDFELNRTRENRFTISGLQLRGDQVPPRDPVLRKAFFREILQKLVDEACPDVVPKPEVTDVYVNMRHGMGAPFIEGRMDSVASATAFRISGSKLAKADGVTNFTGLFIANAVTLTTRVRIEILRALASIMTTDQQEAFVKGFSSRPVMCIKATTPELPPGVEAPPSDPGRNYTFCEAVEKWGHMLDQGSLVKAYRKARPAFNGCLEQYFVVLREFGASESNGIFDLLSASNSTPMGVETSNRGTRGRASFSSRAFHSNYRGRWGRRQAAPGFKRPLSDVVDSPSKVRK